jgi:DNA-binding IscR family transcriptional regulator
VVYVQHVELEVLEVVQALQKEMDLFQVFNLVNQEILEHMVLVMQVEQTPLVMEQDYQLEVVALAQLEEIHQEVILQVLEELEELIVLQVRV